MLIGAALAVVVVLLLGACEPPPPPLVLDVTTTADGADASPGDGVCEMTTGVGDCSLRAAVDEANAWSASTAEIVVPPGTYPLTLPGVDDDNSGGDLDLAPARGSLTLRAPFPGFEIDAAGADGGIDVRSGGLTLLGAAVTGAAGDGVVLRSDTAATVGASSLHGNGGAGLAVAPGALVRTLNVTSSGNDVGIDNDGTLDAELTTVTDNASGGLAGIGAHTLESSVVADQAGGDDCAGAVTSLGSNLDSDGTCGLGAGSDLSGVAAGLAPLSADTLAGHEPTDGSPALDSIAPGTDLCAAGVLSPIRDQRGDARLVGDACDRGAVEADFGLDLVVDSAADVADAAPGDGVCDAGGGVCTLRAAVDETNAEDRTAGHVVTLAVDPVLTLPGDEDANAGGDVDIATNLVVEGDGHTIDAGGDRRGIDHRAGALTIRDATITGADATRDGAGLRTVSDRPLRLESSAVTANNTTNGDGGGLFVGPGADATLVDSTVSANTKSGYYGVGAGIAVEGDLHLIDTDVVDNVVTEGGGGGHGGGVAMYGASAATLHVEGGTFSGNTVIGTGEAVAAYAAAEVRIEGAHLEGTGADDVILTYAQETVIDGSTVEGRIWARGPSLSVTSSTLQSIGGSALRATTSTSDVALTAVTVSGTGSGSVPLLDLGAADYVLAGTVLSAPGRAACDEAVTSGGHNVATDATCGLDGPGDLQSTDPLLGALADNGGPAPTRLPAANSPAVDAVPAGTPGLCDGTLPTDQRGLARPDGADCDVGAVEGTGPAVVGPTLVVDTPDDAVDVTPGDGLCDDGGGHCTLRAAIAEATASPATDTITIAPGVDPVLTSGEIAGDGYTTIDGQGATISGGGAGRLLHHDTGSLTLRSMRLTAGTGTGTVALNGGGAVYVEDAALVVRDSVVDANTTTGSGGGLYNKNGPTLVEGSTLSGNTASTGGAVGTFGGAVEVVSSTLSGNTATGSAGAGAIYGDSEVVASTVAGNTGFSAFRNLERASASILSAPVGRLCYYDGVAASDGYNVASDSSCGLDEAGDVEAVNALLAPLADNGGGGPTHLPAASSPAVDRIPAGAAGLCDGTLPLDQRGVGRPDGTGCDAGAVEGRGPDPVPLSLVVTSAADAPDVNPGDGVCDGGGGACTLRAAIDETNRTTTSDTIAIAPGIDPVLSQAGIGEDANATGDLDVAGFVAIDGGGATIDADGVDRVLHLRGGHLTLTDVTVTGGSVASGDGGGILAATDLVVDGSEISGNVVSGFGGGVMGEQVTVRSSLVRANTSGSIGGGLRATWLAVESSTFDGNEASRGGGLYADVAAVRDSTISRNTAASRSGVYAGGLAMERSTISGNVATHAGESATAGVVSVSSASTVTASTIADNGGGTSVSGPLTLTAVVVSHGGGGTACATPVSSGGYNVVADASCGISGTGDQSVVPALLGALADNGGPTETHLPSATSAAIDAIPTGTPGLCDSGAVDQRGVARPDGPACDVGAVEGAGVAVVSLDLVVDSPLDAPDAAPGDGVCDDGTGACTLRAAADEVNASSGPDTITIAPGVDPVLTLPGAGEDANAAGDIDLVGFVAIDGGGATIDGAGLDRVFDHGGGALTLAHATITGGAVAGDGGGLRSASGDVALTDVVVAGNDASGDGGGAVVAATATITRSTVSDNDAGGVGGGLVGGVDLRLEDSTVSGNTATSGGGVAWYSGATGAVTRSTISTNQAASGAGLWRASGSGPAVDVTAATLADNAGGPSIGAGTWTLAATVVDPASGAACASRTGITAGAANVFPDNSCSYSGADITAVDPQLGSLADNGGPTATHLPFATSPVLDVVVPGTVGLCDGGVVDQRGVARPVGTGCDAGAVEGDNGIAPTPLALVVDDPGDGGDVAPGDGVCDAGGGACTLRAAVDETNVWPTADVISIAGGVTPLVAGDPGDDLNRTGDLDLFGDVTLQGPGTIELVGGDRTLDHHRGELVLDGLTVHGGGLTLRGDADVRGSVVEAGWGVLAASGADVDIDASHIRDNASSGIRTESSAAVRVTASTISANAAVRGGAIQAAEGSLVQVSTSTLSGNTASTAGSAVYAFGPSRVEVVGPFDGVLVPSVELSWTTVVGDGPATLLDGEVPDYQACTLSCFPVNVSGWEISVATSALSSGGPVCWTAGTTTSDTVATDGTCTGAAQVADLLVGPLADNGGSTPTHLPMAASPLVDRWAAGAGPCGVGLADQRGVVRPVGAGCDAGAVEGSMPVAAGPVLPLVDSAADTADAAPGDGVCDDGTGACTLRAAVDETNVVPGDDTITIAAGVDPTLGIPGADEDGNISGDLDVFGQLTIDGGGATVSGGGLDRVLDLHGFSTVHLSDLTVTGGSVGVGALDGGGVRTNGVLVADGVTISSNSVAGSSTRGGGLFVGTGGSATLDGSTVDANVAGSSGSAGSRGAGIFVDGSLTLVDSTISSNLLRGTSTAGGGLAVEGTATVTSSLISANTSGGTTGAGGGIDVAEGEVTVTASTISGNSAWGGGAVRKGLGQGAVHLRATTVADNDGLWSIVNNTAASRVELAGSIVVPGIGTACGGTQPTSLGWNVVADATCGLAQAGDLASTDPLLGLLGGNGGPTLSHLPGVGSAAIDRIPAGTPGLCDGSVLADQRGAARPSGAACDVGAVEQ